MASNHPSCELMLLYFVHEYEREAFTFSATEARRDPHFLSDFKAMIREGLIEVEKPDEFGVVYFRVSEDGHQKVAEFEKSLWSEYLPLLEETFRKYNQ
ncbi:MAG TPA: hypothetical protein VMR46_03390 [Candidatus Paceibacterota bacterium]|nr:hypothetical protein [Candidatus Paceibacterota bacterium]